MENYGWTCPCGYGAYCSDSLSMRLSRARHRRDCKAYKTQVAEEKVIKNKEAEERES